MDDQKLLERISINPKVMAGKPIIKGTRLTVEYILGLLAHHAAIAEILEEYHGLTEEDIRACLLFASSSPEAKPVELEKFDRALRRLEPVDMRQIRIWRSMTPAQRAGLAGQLYRLTAEIVRATERQRHPEAAEMDLRWHVIRRLHGNPRLGRS